MSGNDLSSLLGPSALNFMTNRSLPPGATVAVGMPGVGTATYDGSMIRANMEPQYVKSTLPPAAPHEQIKWYTWFVFSIVLFMLVVIVMVTMIRR
jgi:hypothetical protein